MSLQLQAGGGTNGPFECSLGTNYKECFTSRLLWKTQRNWVAEMEALVLRSEVQASTPVGMNAGPRVSKVVSS